MSDAIKEIFDEAILESEEEGEANGKKKTIVSLFKDGTISKKKAMSLLNVTLQEFSELLTIY